MGPRPGEGFWFWDAALITHHTTPEPPIPFIHPRRPFEGGRTCIWSRKELAYPREQNWLRVRPADDTKTLQLRCILGLLDGGKGSVGWLVGLAGKEEGGSFWLNRLNDIGAARVVVHYNS